MANAERSPDEAAATSDGAALARGWLERAPFVAHLGIRLQEMEPGRAVLAMPFSDSLPTIGDVVHGGAISSLVDTASTIGLTVDFLAPTRGQGVTADARVVRRGGTGLCVCEVSVAADDGTRVALALVTYQL